MKTKLAEFVEYYQYAPHSSKYTHFAKAQALLAEERAQAVQTRLNNPWRNAILELVEEIRDHDRHDVDSNDIIDDLEKILAKVDKENL